MLPIKNGLKQGGFFSPLLFNFALGCAIRRVRVKQEGLKLNGTHQLLVYADDVLLGGSVCTIERETGALVVSSKEIRSKC
jgi:hypothetical protein